MGEMDDAVQGSCKSGRDEEDQMINFMSSGRSGRRDAVPEVDAQGVNPDTTKLAERLSSMNTDSCDNYTINDNTEKKDTIS
ncbi:cAMP-dependent protein kinase inhibitor beta [Dirofilaria immitis]